MFSFDWNCESVDDRAENFEQLGDPVERLVLVDKRQQNVVDCLTDEATKAQKFSINSVQHRFQSLALSAIIRFEQVHQLKRVQFLG